MLKILRRIVRFIIAAVLFLTTTIIGLIAGLIGDVARAQLPIEDEPQQETSDEITSMHNNQTPSKIQPPPVADLNR